MHLYFPTSSLNFNDFFATESISPKKFYSDRIFGTKRHFVTEWNIDDNYLTWFTSIPSFELLKNQDSEYEEYPLIIELECEPEKDGFCRIDDDIYTVNKTIYFNTNNVSFLFLSESVLNKILIKSRLVDETKLVEKYKYNMSVIEGQQVKLFNKPALQEILSFNENIDENLKNDKIFNNIKGFLYAWISKGWLSEYKKNQMYISLFENYREKLNQTILLSNQLMLDTTELLNYVQKQSKKNSVKNIQLDLFPIEHIRDNKLLSLKPVFGANELENKAFEIILNTILQYPKSKVGEVGHTELEQLVSKVKNELLLKLGDVNEYRSDIDAIQKKVADRITEMNIEQIHSLSLKSFMIFLMKCNNIDEMETYMKDRNVDDEYISYSFLGAFFGFSGLSRRVTYELLDGNNSKLFNQIDKELNHLHKQLETNNSKIIKNNLTNNFINNKKNDDMHLLNTKNNEEFYLKRKLIEELSYIKSAKAIRRYLKKPSPLKINNDTDAFLNQDIKGITMLFKTINSDTNLYIYLVHKNYVTIQEKDNFKTMLDELHLNKSYCQGDYPVFSYKKEVKNKNLELNFDDYKQLYSYVMQLKK
ncbi:hypothetical protein HQN87_03720 [Paenibacillus tritici]|uniref:DUF2357 domain-containing protein n=1 Tax=Paenibacillus tritici TaxID=1873425 RepID=A0ABX2DJD8_9BACL|nr:hypothetical protein [Paenibacillus tritici]NQX44432.1 hypothetical protein [Paenibacillus tritici]